MRRRRRPDGRHRPPRRSTQRLQRGIREKSKRFGRRLRGVHPVHVPRAEVAHLRHEGLGEVHVERLSRRRRVRVPVRVRTVARGERSGREARQFEETDWSWRGGVRSVARGVVVGTHGGGAAAQRVRIRVRGGRSGSPDVSRFARGGVDDPRVAFASAGKTADRAGSLGSCATRPTRSRRSMRCAAGLCACARAPEPGPEPASEAWSTPRKISDASRPACRSRMRRPPGCASAPKSYTPPSTMRMDAPASARRRTSSRVYTASAPAWVDMSPDSGARPRM